MKVLAVDYGDRRIGLALSDELGIAAHGLPTLEVRSLDDAVQRVVGIIAEKAPERVVVGLPLNMDGSSGPRADQALRFCEKCRQALRRRGLAVPVEAFDERLTTVRARHALREAGLDERKQRRHVDRTAAVILLQDYLQTVRST